MTENPHQPEFVDQRTGTDCLRACIATITGEPYEAAPDLSDSPVWRNELRRWARQRGGDFVFTPDSDLPTVTYFGQRIAIGPSPRGDFTHAVVVDEALRLVHDPHRSRDGIGEITEVITWAPPYEPAPVVAERCVGRDLDVVVARGVAVTLGASTLALYLQGEVPAARRLLDELAPSVVGEISVAAAGLSTLADASLAQRSRPEPSS